MGKIVSITNQKGGVGKTTTAVSLTYSLAEEGKKMLFVDIDPQANGTSSFGVNKRNIKQSVYEVLIGACSVQDAIMHTAYENVDILPTNMNLAGAEIEMVAMENRENLLRAALNKVRHRYDFIIIDCPPSLSLLTLNALNASNSVIIPLQPEYLALEGVSQLINTIKLVKSRYNPALYIEGVLLTMYDGRLNVTLQVAGEIKKYFGSKVYKTAICRNVRLSEAPSHGVPVQIYDRYSKGALAYREMAREFLERNQEQ
ncbi:MAG: ParA family protein [Clostridia bacterium]|nr:ParA family protein [Clostridia bacterium]MBR4087010.1 ParA family protein [Clostridia bacterium]